MTNKTPEPVEHLMFIGNPGAGKTMRARQLAAEPDMLRRFYSLEGDSSRLFRLAQLEHVRTNDMTVPFRAPHHTVSLLGMIGRLDAGWCPRPGELSLAHGGILFLDEVEEFRHDCVDAVLMALKTKQIRMTSTVHSLALPADFRLVVAASPCPCGRYGTNKCCCPVSVVSRWCARQEPFRQVCRVIELPTVSAQ